MPTQSERQAAFTAMVKKGWQSPYVDVFRHFDVGAWQKAARHGEVTRVVDKTIRAKVFKISGSVPASNYIQLPKSSSHSLGLVGRYLYLPFRVLPRKFFAVHLDLATAGGLVVRVSISNLFKDFKATPTWLQFPCVDLTPRWTLLVLDLKAILEQYVSRQFLYLKGVRLCANMYVRTLVTSPTRYEERELPRPLHMYIPAEEAWEDHYDCIRFPFVTQQAEGLQNLIRPGRTPRTAPIASQIVPRANHMARRAQFNEGAAVYRHNNNTRAAAAAAATGDDTSGVVQRQRQLVRGHGHGLPAVGLDLLAVNPETDHAALLTANKILATGEEPPLPEPEPVPTVVAHAPSSPPLRSAYKSPLPLSPSLTPDPIMALHHIVGFGAADVDCAVWATADDALLAYGAGRDVVLLDHESGGVQTFLHGHTAPITTLSACPAKGLLATAQSASHPCVRLWDVRKRVLRGIVPLEHAPVAIELSVRGRVLVTLCTDTQGKGWITARDIASSRRSGVVHVLAEARTDADLLVVRIAPNDDARYVTCGRDSVRLWRIRDGQFRSCNVAVPVTDPAVLRGFTDICLRSVGLTGLAAYVSTAGGDVLEIDCMAARLLRTHRVAASAVCCLALGRDWLATGSDDGFLRVWPLGNIDSGYTMELELDHTPCAAHVSVDGGSLVVATRGADLGVLNVVDAAYKPVSRAHTSTVLSFAESEKHCQIATASTDKLVRVWNADPLAIVCEFGTESDTPTSVAFHPRDPLLATGFASGCVRVFNTVTLSEVACAEQHRDAVICLEFNTDGSRLVTVGADGLVVGHDARAGYKPIRLYSFSAGRTPVASTARDGSRVCLVTAEDSALVVLECVNLTEEYRVPIPLPRGAKVTSLCLTPDGHSVFVGVGERSGSSTLMLMRLGTAAVAARAPNAHRGDISCIAVDSMGKFVLSGGSDGSVCVWDALLPSNYRPQRFLGSGGEVTRVSFARGGSRVLCSGSTLSAWDFYAAPNPVQKAAAAGHAAEDVPTPIEIVAEAAAEEVGAPSGSGAAVIEMQPQAEAITQSSTQERQEKSDLLTPAPEQNGNGSSVVGDSPLDLTDLADLSTPDVLTAAGTATAPRALSVIADADPSSAAESAALAARPVAPLHLEPQSLGTASGCEPDPVRGVVPLIGTSHAVASEAAAASLLPGGAPPDVRIHYPGAPVSTELSAELFAPPTGHAGIKCARIYGVNARAPSSAIWHPQTGVFAYAAGHRVVIEDLATHAQRFLEGHTEEISTLCVSHDGCTIASACGPTHATGQQAQVCLWDVATGTLKGSSLAYHLNDVTCMAFSRDDRHLVTVGNYVDPSIAVWECSTGALLAATQSDQPLHAVAWDPNNYGEFAACGQDGTLLFFLLDDSQDVGARYTRQHKHVLKVFAASLPKSLHSPRAAGPVHFTALEYTEGSVLLLGDARGVVSAWDTGTNTCFKSWQVETAEITMLCSRGGRMVTGSANGLLRLWEATLDADVATFVQEDEMALGAGSVAVAVTSMCFDAVLAMGVAVTADGTVWVVDWSERIKTRLAAGHVGAIRGMALSQDGRYFVTAAEDGSVRVWSSNEREQVMHFATASLGAVASCAAFSPDQQRCAAGYTDGVLRLFDLNAVDLEAKFSPHDRAVTAILFSLDGRVVVSANSGGLVVVSSASTGMTVRILTDHQGAPVTAFDRVLAPERGYAGATSLWLACSTDQRVSVWQANWGQDRCDMVDWLSLPATPFTPSKVTPELPPCLAAFSPGDPNIMLYTSHGARPQVAFYSLSLRRVVKRVALNDWALSLAVSPAGNVLAVGTQGRLLKLVDFEQGAFQDYTAHSDGVRHLAFTCDGHELISVGHADVASWEVLL